MGNEEQQEKLLREWLDCCVTEGGVLVALQKSSRRRNHPLVTQMVEKWLDGYRQIRPCASLSDGEEEEDDDDEWLNLKVFLWLFFFLPFLSWHGQTVKAFSRSQGTTSSWRSPPKLQKTWLLFWSVQALGTYFNTFLRLTWDWQKTLSENKGLQMQITLWFKFQI